jgi:phasin family protein
MASKSKTAKGPVAVEHTIATSKETVEGAIKAGTEAATKALAISKDRIQAATKGYGEMTDFGKDTVEAFVAASSATAKAVEAINAEVLAFSKTAFEDSVAAAKAVLAAKTLKEVVDLQTEFAKTAFESYVQQSSKLGEMTAKLTQEAMQPISARFQAAVEKFAKPLAA